MLYKDIEVLLSNNNLEIEKIIFIKEKNDVIKRLILLRKYKFFHIIFNYYHN